MAKKKPKTQKKSTRDIVPGFAELVRETRVKLGMNQRQLSLLAKVSPMCISDLENGNRSPSFRVALSVAGALGIKDRLGDFVKPLLA